MQASSANPFVLVLALAHQVKIAQASREIMLFS